MRLRRGIVLTLRKIRAFGVDPMCILPYKMFTPPDNPSHITSFWHGRDTDEITQALDEARVSITFQESGALIRASVGMYNNQDDADRLLKVLASMA